MRAPEAGRARGGFLGAPGLAEAGAAWSQPERPAGKVPVGGWEPAALPWHKGTPRWRGAALRNARVRSPPSEGHPLHTPGSAFHNLGISCVRATGTRPPGDPPRERRWLTEACLAEGGGVRCGETLGGLFPTAVLFFLS